MSDDSDDGNYNSDNNTGSVGLNSLFSDPAEASLLSCLSDVSSTRVKKPGYYQRLLTTLERRDLMKRRNRKEDMLQTDNWISWKSRITMTLESHHVLDFITGHMKPPPNNKR
jgi:hypothetical protein